MTCQPHKFHKNFLSRDTFSQFSLIVEFTYQMFFYFRFEICRKLGQGTYGKVQLGINKETGQQVGLIFIEYFKNVMIVAELRT